MKEVKNTFLAATLILLCALSGFAQGTSPNLSAPHVSSSQAQKEVTINEAVDVLDKAIAGTLTKSVAGGSNVTLTTTEAQHAVLKLTGVLTANIQVIVPSKSKQWSVYNSTSGSYTLTVKTASGSGVAVAQGSSVPLYCDGTNVNYTGGINVNSATGDLIQNYNSDGVGSDKYRLQKNGTDVLTVDENGLLDALFSPTMKARLFGYVNVRDYVTGGLGTSGSPLTGWKDAVNAVLGNNMTVVFPPNFDYGFSTTWTLPQAFNLRIIGNGARLHFTGSGRAVDWTCSGCFYNSFDDFIIQGNSNATVGLYLEAWHRGRVRVNTYDTTQYGLDMKFAVEDDVDLTCEGFMGTMPATGLHTSERNPGEAVQRNEFYVKIQATNGHGMDLYNFMHNTLHGSSQYNHGYGAIFRAGSNGNSVFMDNEANVWPFNGTDNDFYVVGDDNVFHSIYSTGTFTIDGARNGLVNGYAHQLVMNPSASDNQILGPLSVDNYFIDNGVNTVGGELIKYTGGANVGQRHAGSRPIGNNVWISSDPSRPTTAVIQDRSGSSPTYGTLDVKCIQLVGGYSVCSGSGAPTGSTPHGLWLNNNGSAPALYVWESGGWVSK